MVIASSGGDLGSCYMYGILLIWRPSSKSTVDHDLVLLWSVKKSSVIAACRGPVTRLMADLILFGL